MAVLRSVLVVLACEKREKSKRGGGKGGFGKACSEKTPPLSSIPHSKIKIDFPDLRRLTLSSARTLLENTPHQDKGVYGGLHFKSRALTKLFA